MLRIGTIAMSLMALSFEQASDVTSLRVPVAAIISQVGIKTGPCTWTDWLDMDNPSGNGDYEMLEGLIKQGNKICAKPT